MELQLPMPVVLMESHSLVEETRNQLAVMRGPLVYCLEDQDLPPGVAIESVRIERDAKWQVRREAHLLHGVTVLETQARVVSRSKDATALYRRAPGIQDETILLRLIPYLAREIADTSSTSKQELGFSAFEESHNLRPGRRSVQLRDVWSGKAFTLTDAHTFDLPEEAVVFLQSPQVRFAENEWILRIASGG